MADSTGAALPSDAHAKERKLESWGEIAAYLRREIRTVQRWETNYGLPVRRLKLGKQSAIWAFPSELDKWYQERGREMSAEEPVPALEVTPDEPEPPPSNPLISNDRKFAAPPEKIAWHKRKSVWFSGMALLLVASSAAVWNFTFAVRSRNQISDPKLRLLVLPFQNISGDLGQAEFTEGMTNELNIRLGKLDPKRLGVIAPTSALQLSAKPISELESTLKLNYVLEGSVHRANDQVRINVSLISAKDQTQLWSDSYTENMSDILKVQERVAEAVAQKLLINLPGVSGEKSTASVDPEGYSSYLRGRRFWALRDLSRSIPAFEDAVKRMPTYAPGHAGLAASYALIGQAPNDAVPPSISAPKAKVEAERALALDPANAEAHYVLGNLAMSFDFDFPSAEREFHKAISLEPNNATAHQWYGHYLMTQNRLPEAEAETLKALELDPVSPIFTTTRAEVYYYAGNFDGTLAQAQLTLEESPNFLLGEFWLASGYRQKKMYPEAIRHFRKAESMAPGNPALLMVLGHTLAVSGDRPGALAILSQLKTMAKQRYVPSSYIAGVYLGLGDSDNAFVYLNRAVTEHNDRLMYLGVEPMGAPLRADPRFQTLLRQIHLDHFN